MVSDKSGPPLGRQVSGSSRYDPSLLYPIERSQGRARLGLDGARLPFRGEDLWHAYELSWLEPGGRPRVAVGTLAVAADTPRMVESKSLKLYLNSLNGSPYPSAQAVREVVAADVAAAAGGGVRVELLDVEDSSFHGRAAPGVCVDDAPFTAPAREPDSSLLAAGARPVVEETLHSHLLRSLCPVTAQPDWATLVVSYRGPRLAHEALLRYVAAFREQQDFHEQCVERIFRDLGEALEPEWLVVQAFYTRRGGLAISPWRSSGPEPPPYRLYRQ